MTATEQISTQHITHHHSKIKPFANFYTEMTDLGKLMSTPIQKLEQSVNYTNNPVDVYKFTIDAPQNINLALYIQPNGSDPDHIDMGDAVFNFYEDTDKNGTLSSSDKLLGTSHTLYPSLFDNAINQRVQTKGTYFAQVQFSPTTSSSTTHYQLDLSTSPSSDINPSLPGPSNLLPTENKIYGFISNNTSKTFNGRIDDTNTSDVIGFSAPYIGSSISYVHIDLTGLSADADIRVIQDFDNNKLVGANEVYGRSVRGGSNSESLDVYGGGTFLVQVYQYSGNTNYQLTLTEHIIPA
jgi:hypothetical protein